MSKQVRAAKRADIPAIRAVLVATWHATYDALFGAKKVTEITNLWHSEENLARQWAEAEANPSSRVFLVAGKEGPLLATASASLADHDVVDLARLYVLPDHQGAGYGKALLRACIAHFPTARSAKLEVAAGNRQAIAFYQRCGFCEVSSGAACGGDAQAALAHINMITSLPLSCE